MCFNMVRAKIVQLEAKQGRVFSLRGKALLGSNDSEKDSGGEGTPGATL